MAKKSSRDADISIDVMPDGPLIVKNLEKLSNSSGQAVEVKAITALCRCGASKNKPYCDGSHKGINFSGERETDRDLLREKAYSGENIVIHDNRTICSHAAECVKSLNSVFDLEKRPWINPDGADNAAIIDLIRRCPSGALSYTLNDKQHRDVERPPQVQITRNGPYNVSGNIALNVEQDIQPPSQEHFSLCRCGASKNKPYCDGSHHTISFRDEDN